MSADDQFIEPDFIEPDVPVQASSGNSSSGNTGSANNVSGLSGNMDVIGGLNRGTLDESVAHTLKRDVYDINSKLKQVVYPHMPSRRYMAEGTTEDGQNNDDQIFSSSDFWAPLAFIILYAVCVSHAKTLFSSVFVSSWFVLLVMALHLKLTKPRQNASLLSYISLSGYCLFPLVINALVVQIILPAIFHAMKESQGWKVRIHSLLKLTCFAFCFVWSFSCSAIVTRAKGFVQLYPLGLCLFGLGWLSVIL